MWMDNKMLDKNGCERKLGYPYNEIPVANTHTITAEDITQPDGTIKRVYTASAPTLKSRHKGDKV